jgi:hypothetical protein
MVEFIHLYKYHRLESDRNGQIKHRITYHNSGGPYIPECNNIHDFAQKLASWYQERDIIKLNQEPTLTQDGLEILLREPLNSEELSIVATHLAEKIKADKMKKEKK